MTGNDASNHDPDELLDGLRAIAGQVDPVPREATAFAHAALGWRRIDAELAELLVDSALDSESLALTRSTLARARSVTFRASDLEIALEIQETERGVLILGQVAPPTRAGIEVQRDDSSLAASAETDELGRFRLELPDRGRVRLLVRRQPPEPPIETSWIGI